MIRQQETTGKDKTQTTANENKDHGYPALGVPTEGPRGSTRQRPPTCTSQANNVAMHHQQTKQHHDEQETGNYPTYSAAAINPDTGKAAEYRKLVQSTAGLRWTLAMNKEIGQLFQGFECPADPAHSV